MTQETTWWLGGGLYACGAAGLFAFQCLLYDARRSTPPWISFWLCTFFWLPFMIVSGALAILELAFRGPHVLPSFMLKTENDEEETP